MGVRADDTALFPRFLDLEYPNVERGEGVWLTTTDGRRVIDASSGGAMVTCLGHAVAELAAAAAWPRQVTMAPPLDASITRRPSVEIGRAHV